MAQDPTNEDRKKLITVVTKSVDGANEKKMEEMRSCTSTAPTPDYLPRHCAGALQHDTKSTIRTDITDVECNDASNPGFTPFGSARGSPTAAAASSAAAAGKTDSTDDASQTECYKKWIELKTNATGEDKLWLELGWDDLEAKPLGLESLKSSERVVWVSRRRSGPC